MSDALSIFRAADEAPDAPAWIDAQGVTTFRGLADEARRFLPALAALGPEARVALTATPERASVVRLLAALELGVPVALLHPRWAEIERTRARAAVEAVDLDALAPCDAPTPRAARASDAVLVFTSGTTGVPRAARLSRAALIASAQASAEVLGEADDDRWLLAMPLAHVGGLSIVLRALRARRPVIATRPDTIASAARAHRASLLSVVPTMLERLLAEPPPESLRRVLVGGAACPEPLRQRALAAGWPVRTTYGLTETCAQVATQRGPTDGGVGPLLPRVELEVRHERLFVRGPTLFSGFWGEPSPLDDRGFYDTGDFGHLDGRGHLHLLGRRTDLIVSGGENVYPAEVERVLEALPGITAACVFGIPDAQWGSTVAAALVAEPRPSSAELAAHLDRYLARYKHPRRVAFVEALATAPSGKLDRRRTAEIANDLLSPMPARGANTV